MNPDSYGYPPRLVDKTYRILVRSALHGETHMHYVSATSKLEAIDATLQRSGYRGVINEVWIQDDEKNFQFVGSYRLVERWTQI